MLSEGDKAVFYTWDKQGVEKITSCRKQDKEQGLKGGRSRDLP